MSLLRNRLVLGAAFLILLAVIGRGVWNRFGTVVSSHPRFQLSEENVEITPPPNWIHSDVKKSALELAKVHESSLLDRDVVSKVTEAFRVQTWVSQVSHVTKSPRGLDIGLEYRRPVAMVEIVDQGSAKLQPVDGQGVLLPGSEFSRAQVADFLRISVPQPKIHGLIDGTVWPDERVVAASMVAEFISEYREALGLFRVNLLQSSNQDGSSLMTFEIETQRGHRIIWGSPPGQQHEEEASSERRLEALTGMGETLSNIEKASRPILFDLRTGDVIRISLPNEPSGRLGQPSQHPWGLDDSPNQ